MPEKPEVITVANTLKKRIIGKKITNCKVLWDNIIASPKSNEFSKRMFYGITSSQVLNQMSFLKELKDKYFMI